MWEGVLLRMGGLSTGVTYEFERRGLSFGRECEMPVVYEGVQVGTRRVDFFVEGGVLLELKAVSMLEAVSRWNFAARNLEFWRMRNVV